MRNIKSQSSVFLTLALASWILAFGLPASSANQQQDPVVTSNQISALPTAAATSEDRVALYQALLDLQNPWTVMCVAAHPDDEDGTSLIVMRHKYGAHTVSLFSTFGEGGQNAIGPELYEELGAIRARETMAAAEIQGSEPHFLGLKDFGFSKTRDEAFRFWGHEEALRRMVLQIRKLRPDVIITNHSTTSNDHGQHQATALMVVEAFDAAADATRFPDQLKDGVTTWQVQRLFVRARGNQQQAANAQLVTIDPNETDPVRGVVYAEEALRGLQQHATQGPWPKSFEEYRNRFRAFSGQNSPGGQLPMIRYALVKSAKDSAPMPAQESHNFVDGLPAPTDAANLASANLNGQSLTAALDDRQRLLSSLLAAKKSVTTASLSRRNHTARFDRQNSLIDQAIGLAAGITTSITPAHPVVIPGSSNKFSVTITNSGNTSPWLIATASDAGDSRLPRFGEVTDKRPHQIMPGKSETLSLTYAVPAGAAITVPNSEHLYDGHLFSEAASMSVTLKLNDVEVVLPARTLVDVAPPIEIANLSPSPLALSPAKAKLGPATFTVTLTNHQSSAFAGQLMTAADITDNWPKGTAVKLAAGEKKTISYTYAPPADANLARSNFLSLWAEGMNARSPHETVRVFSTNAATAPNLRVGYVRGFDFSLPNALSALGVESKELSVDDVKTGDLSQFTSVIVDNRVYESKPELIAVNQKLLDYANAGGNLIVFYHKSDEWNPDERRNRPQLAPYKLILGGERVTDENAPITFIEPDHPLLNTPNKMSQDDFRDWIQERGLYYPKEWDPQFHALLQSNDPGENPLKGGLLVADYGQGHYIYTSMVWYRELRGGIPGAYRMLANMISYGRN